MAKKLFLFFLLFFIFPYSVLATDYYVSTSGNDSNSGMIDRPFGTLQKSANVAVAGDTVYIRGGTYHQTVTFSNSGTQTSPITVSGYQNEKVILDGTDLSAYYMVHLSGDWIKVSGLEIKNTTTNGAAIFLEGNHCTAENNKVHDNYDAAIHINGDYGLAQGNQVWNNGLINENNKSGVSGGWPAIVSCVRNYNNPTPEYCTLRGNIVWGNWGEGISVFEQIYATLEDNISYNNQQNIYLSDTKYSVVQRNISYCTPGNAIDPYMTQNGLLVGDEKGVLIDGVRRTSSDNKILNNLFMGCDRNLAAGTSESTNNLYAYNTFVNSGGDASERANVLLYGGSCTNCRFIDNLTLQENSIPITLGGGTGWQFSNNFWSGDPSLNFKGTNDITNANPGLAKSGSTGPGQLTVDYFKLTASSLAVDKAKVLSEVAEDYFKTSRGANPDIGAHEYTGVTPTLIPTLTPTPGGSLHYFKTGWWMEMYDTDYAASLAKYATEGNTLVLGNGGGWVTSASERIKIQRFLDEAQKYDIKVIVSLTKSRGTPYSIPVNEFTDTINAFKNHPALYGWYLGDEPEIYNNNDANRSDDWQITHSYLATDPGYYYLAKVADPNHPVFISFNMVYTPIETYWTKILNFFDVTDLVGMHNYPFWSVDQYVNEFYGTDTRTQYDKWKLAFEDTINRGKTGFIATAQGFGYNNNDAVYRDPTYNELRHQVFSAVVLGIDKVLFWYDDWSNDNVKNLVRQMTLLEQQIGEEMNNGTTNDSRISVSITDRDQLVYRYGISGSKQILLAVNIAGRKGSTNVSLNGVRFTIPGGYNGPVVVVGENRTTVLTAVNGSFTDDFAPFAVHIYSIPQSGTTPTPTVILCARKGEGDANCDGVITILDFETWRREFLGIDTTTKSDFDSSGGVTILDFEIWRRGFLK